MTLIGHVAADLKVGLYTATRSDADCNPTDNLFTIGRVMRNYGHGQYIGALVTDTEFAGEQPRGRG
jgi:hypothetical protein